MQNFSDTDYSLLSDAMLVELLKTHDAGAFQEIYQRYWHVLFVVARRKLNSQEIAEEIVQDLFTSIWARRAETHIEDLKKYLFSSIKYLVINAIKSKVVREEYQSQTVLSGGYASTQRTEEELAYRDLYSAIEDGLLQLSDKTQHVFRLNRLENQSVREISISLNIPERTVEYHITQALRVLRLHLRDYLLSALLFFSSSYIQ